MGKYEEALERAKQGLPIDEVFPELKESEDERIRKHLLTHFKNKTKETWCCMPVKDIVAYLEKQKSTNSEKPKEWSEEDEKHKEAIIESIRLVMMECADSESIEKYEKDIDWLENRFKFFRPRHITYALDAPLCYDKDMNPIYPPINHWKPTEKQFAALEWQIKNTYEGSWQRRASEDLYNDLKKL